MLTLTSRIQARRRTREDSHAMVQTLVAIGLLCVTTLALLAAPVPTGKPGNYPAWWFSRGVIAQKNPTNASPAWPANYPTANDYGVINEGQLKNLATAAYNELVAQAPTNVWTTPQGTNLTAMVTGWSNTGNNYAAINLGQLKTVAKPFYDVLVQIGYTSGYPWTGINADDYAAANIGQAKYAFSFDVGLDSDGNGLPDWWELDYLGQTGNVAGSQSPAGDGYTLAQEYAMGRNPDDYYQGVAPLLAIVSGNNQTNSAGAFLTNALVVQVENSSSVPLTNAPVVFWSTTGGGLATNTTTAPVSSCQMVRTGAGGQAQIYFQQPLVAAATNTVSVAAGTATNVTFSATTPADTAAPAAPTGVTAVAGPTSGEIDLTWTNHADNATSLIIQQSTDGATWTTAATLTDVTSTSYAVTGGLTSGTPYYFRVEASNGSTTTPSSPTSTTPPGTGAVPRYALIDLGTNMDSVAMNNSNVVVGNNYNTSPSTPQMWSNGTNTALPFGSFTSVETTGIDDSGHMVGYGTVAISSGGTTGSTDEVAYWANSASTASGLGTNIVLPGWSEPYGFASLIPSIGGDGSIVGTVFEPAAGGSVAATFTPGGSPAYLWVPGQAGGWVQTTSKARGHWAGWCSIDDDTPPGIDGAVVDGTEYPNLYPYAVNDSGVAVGTDYTNPDGIPSSTYVGKNINTLLPPNSGWTVTGINAINNSGSIAGGANYSGTDSA
jgi:hypothetical protein